MQLFGRGRAKRAVEAPTQIAVGANLPDVEIEALLFQLPTESEGGTQATDVKAAVLPLTKARRMCMAPVRYMPRVSVAITHPWCAPMADTHITCHNPNCAVLQSRRWRIGQC